MKPGTERGGSKLMEHRRAFGALLSSSPAVPGQAAAKLQTAPIWALPQLLSCLQSSLGHRICPWFNTVIQLKSYHHPTFIFNYKDRRLSTETFLLLGTASPWVHLTFISLSLVGIFPKHKPYSQVSWISGWHIILPLQLHRPILIESGVFTAHLWQHTWLLPDTSKNHACLKPRHLQCS